MMKRGLSSPDPSRDSAGITQQRLDVLREHARRQGVEAALVYGDVGYGGDIAYLGHAMLYWADAVLVVPVEGEVALAKTLGPRTDKWFRETSMLDDLRSGPQLAPLVSALLAERGLTRVGLVDGGQFPALVEDALHAAGVEMIDLGRAVSAMRAIPDDAALADFYALGKTVQAAIAAGGLVFPGDPAHLRAETEYTARMGGVWDAQALVHPTPDGGAVLDLRCQLRDAWFASQRTFGDSGPMLVELFATLSSALRPGSTLAALAELLPDAAPGTTRELVIRNAAEIEWEPIVSESGDWRAEDGAIVHLLVRDWRGGLMVAAHGDTLRVTTSGGCALVLE